MTALAAMIRRDIQIALRVGGGALIGVLFFSHRGGLDAVRDRTRSRTAEPARSRKFSGSGALLASLLTLDRLFMADHEDGSLI